MKVSLKDLNELHFAIAPLDTLERRKRYINGDYLNSEYTKDLWRRYRWDLYWECGYLLESGKYKDSHIDTALRHVVAPFDIALELAFAVRGESPWS